MGHRSVLEASLHRINNEQRPTVLYRLSGVMVNEFLEFHLLLQRMRSRRTMAAEQDYSCNSDLPVTAEQYPAMTHQTKIFM